MKSLKSLLMIVFGFTIVSLNAQMDTLQVVNSNGDYTWEDLPETLTIQYNGNIYIDTINLVSTNLWPYGTLSEVYDGQTIYLTASVNNNYQIIDSMIVDLYNALNIVSASTLSNNSIYILTDSASLIKHDSIILMRQIGYDENAMYDTINKYSINDTIIDMTANILNDSTYYTYKLYSINCHICNTINESNAYKRATIYLQKDSVVNDNMYLSWNYPNDLSLKDTIEFNLIHIRGNNILDTIIIYASNNIMNNSDTAAITSSFQKFSVMINGHQSGDSYLVYYDSNLLNIKSLNKISHYIYSNVDSSAVSTPIVFDDYEYEYRMVNPSNGLDIICDKLMDIKVYDMSGQLVDMQTGKDIKSYSYDGGLYFVVIEIDGHVKVEKLFVN